ncbi:glycosyltransferase [Pelagibacteraceae bacterium]|nr:glycosyltransferase [Pelagibacteraceae bacterium]
MDIKELSIILVSYYSYDHLKRIYNNLKNFKIIVIENSNDLKVKKFFEKKKNITVFFPNKNLGYGGGNNYGINIAKTKYCLILNPDTVFKKTEALKLINYTKIIDDFGILLPRLDNKKSINVFNNKKKYIKANFKFIGQDYASGCAMLINKSKFKSKKIFDENFFLYKEETDLIKRCQKQKINCYLLKDVKVKHIGTSSIKTKKIKNIENEIFRNWHWTWSNFYFYKKNYGFCYSFIKFFRSILSSFIKQCFYYSLDRDKYKIYKARFNGYKSSIFNKKSFYRIKV